MAAALVYTNSEKWIKENEKYFLPPVCNRMLHNSQLKVFYVGGPNLRKDYHYEEGEELFYMKKGNMCLKIIEGGRFRDVIIEEGQVFLLPGRIPHSPQRYSDTIGLVIERERLQTELDAIKYFVEENGQPTLEPLYEKWFFCHDLGSQLGPLISAFFASEQYKTGKPIAHELPTKVPWQPDENRRVEAPFSLENWLNMNQEEIQTTGCKRLFDTTYQSDIMVLGYGSGERHILQDGGDAFLMMLRGHAEIEAQGSHYHLGSDDTLLIPKYESFYFIPKADCMVLFVQMSAVNRLRSVC